MWSKLTKMEVSVYEAKTRLSSLIDRVMAGEEVIITRHGRPVARLGRLTARRQPRTLGRLAGKIRMAPDFDAPLPADVRAGFEGRTKG